MRLQECGFNTWCKKAWELIETYDLKLNSNLDKFKKQSKIQIHNLYIQNYFKEIHDQTKNPIARTYSLFKTDFKIEPYLDLIKNYKYRKAFTKLRTSSHALRIETGRHGATKCPIHERLCSLCNVIEDEPHFLISCTRYRDERKEMFDVCLLNNAQFTRMNENDKFIYLMKSNKQNNLYHISKFIFLAFDKRNNEICS